MNWQSFRRLKYLSKSVQLTRQLLYFLHRDHVETTIMDVLGRKIKVQSTKIIKGNNSFDLTIDDLASATYLIKFQSNNTTITKKFVKK
ncbi:MAG: T9SS type A sorting domain-containing protein [Chitinophagales bacterium]